MKVAIPVFGTRVAPRFDGGPVLLVAEVDSGAVGPSQQVVDAATNSLQRIARLRELGVEVVVCGAITGFVLRHLAANGIQVFPWVSCEAGEALAALARGELPSTPVPGMGSGRGRGRGGRGKGRRGPRWPR